MNITYLRIVKRSLVIAFMTFVALVIIGAISTAPASAQLDISPLPTTKADKTTIDDVIKLILNIVGAICVLIITISGFKYAMSLGDPGATKRAKDTILYALIGLVIIVFANIIISFVIQNL